MSMNKVSLLPIDIGIRLLKIIAGLMMYASGLIIYIAGGITIIMAVSCYFFGLVTGDGVKHIIVGSMVLLLMLAGASAIAAVLVRLLENLKRKMDR